MKRGWAAAARLSVFFACALALQWYGGAYASEGGGDPDEPGHIVTGLMVRQYAAEGLGESPMHFARSYYLHYPKVALGHWPPVFYIEQAMWTLVFPSTRSSLLVLIALFASVMAAITYPIVEARAGTLIAWSACLLLLSAPGVALYDRMVMTEIPLALSILAAMIFFGLYVDTGSLRYAVLFGVSAAVSLLTKGSGLVLSLLPILAVTIARRWDLLRRGSFWLPALLVVGICAPWYLLAPSALHERVIPLGGPGLIVQRWALPPGVWAGRFGWVFSSLVLIGLAWVIFRAVRREPVQGIWASAAAVVISGTLFPMFFAVWERRHQVEEAAAFAMLAAGGALWAMSRLPAKISTAVVAGGTLLMLASNVAGIQRQEPSNYGRMADAIVRGEFATAKVILVSSDPTGEGVLVSEVAQREPSPIRYMLRGSKLLADVSWLGTDSRERFATGEEIGSYLSSLPVDLVILDRARPTKFKFGGLLAAALEGNPEGWEHVELTSRADEFTVYRRLPDARRSEVQTSEGQIDDVLAKALSSMTP